MDNSMATTPRSTLKGDAYRAYEALPPVVRRALQESLVDWCPLRAREWHLRLLNQQRMKPAQAAEALVQAIRGHDQAEVKAFARAWPKGPRAYPHLAAEATLQRYAGPAGMPAPKPVAVAEPSATGRKPGPAAQPRLEANAQPRPKASAKPRPKANAKPRPKARPKRAAGRRSRR
jgi:hypothetical protein